jgi:outer membrane protein OmpA-like peptidoglycan-associated protein
MTDNPCRRRSETVPRHYPITLSQLFKTMRFLTAFLVLALSVRAAGAQDAPTPDSLASVIVLSGDTVDVTPTGLERVRRRIAAIRSGVVRQIVYPIIVVVPDGIDSTLIQARVRDLETQVGRDSAVYRTPVFYRNLVVYEDSVVYQDTALYRNQVFYRNPVVYQDSVVYRDSVVYQGPVVYRDSVRFAEPAVDALVPADTTAPAADAAVVERALLESGLFGALSVQFPFNESTLLPASEAVLNTLGAILERYPGLRLEVRGHADSSGPEAYNQRLSEQRAEATRRYLLDRFAIAPERITAHGLGERQPIAGNATPTGRALNRHVGFVVTRQERR